MSGRGTRGETVPVGRRPSEDRRDDGGWFWLDFGLVGYLAIRHHRRIRRLPRVQQEEGPEEVPANATLTALQCRAESVFQSTDQRGECRGKGGKLNLS